MEFPLGKPYDGDRSEPCDLIVRASLGIDHHTELYVPYIEKGSRTTVFAYTGKFSYPIDVRYEVESGSGFLNFFDHDGNYLRNQPLEQGSRGTLLAGENYEYMTFGGRMTVLESDNGVVDDEVYGDV